MRNHVFSKHYHAEAFFFLQKIHSFLCLGGWDEKVFLLACFQTFAKNDYKRGIRIVFLNQFYTVAKKDLPHSTIAIEGRNIGHVAKKTSLLPFIRSYFSVLWELPSGTAGSPPPPPPPPSSSSSSSVPNRTEKGGREEGRTGIKCPDTILWSLWPACRRKGDRGKNKPIFFCGNVWVISGFAFQFRRKQMTAADLQLILPFPLGSQARPSFLVLSGYPFLPPCRSTHFLFPDKFRSRSRDKETEPLFPRKRRIPISFPFWRGHHHRWRRKRPLFAQRLILLLLLFLSQISPSKLTTAVPPSPSQEVKREIGRGARRRRLEWPFPSFPRGPSTKKVKKRPHLHFGVGNRKELFGIAFSAKFSVH